MIIDDSICIKGTTIGTSKAVTTADCIDKTAAGTCLDGFPTFVCHLTAPITLASAASYDGTGSLTLTTCDTDDGSYVDVVTVYIGNDKLANGRVGKIAQIDMPKENVKRFIKFRLDLSKAPDASSTGAFDIIPVPGAAVGL